VATWDLGDRLSICLKAQENQETLCQDGRRADRRTYRCLLTASRQCSRHRLIFIIVEAVRTQCM